MADQLADFVRVLWSKHFPRTMARVTTLEVAVAGLLASTCTDAEKDAALSEAHRLAGSLGSYGLHRGSELARKAEMIFEEKKFDAASLLALSEMLVEIRKLVEAGPAKPVEQPPVETSRAIEQPSLVVVEDDLLLRDLLVHLFSIRNFAIRSYEEGDSALRDLMAPAPLRPKVLILDIDLPGTSGMTILRELARTNATREMKVLMLTARNSEAEVLESLRLGAADHISKPFSVPILLEKVMNALQ